MTDKDKEVKTKVVDPGWNDPPVFSYETHQTHIRQSKGLALNKRVVFPISSTNDLQTSECTLDSGTVGTPPLGASISSTPPKNIIGPPKDLQKIGVSNIPESCIEEKNVCENTDTPSLDVLLENFNSILQQVYNNEEKEAVEVKRRLTIMEKLWKEEKFNDVVKKNVFKLSLAIKEDKLDDADNLQRSLMVDYSGVCSSWMAAVRKLIYLKKDLANS